MAFNKTEKTDSPMRKKGGMRRRKKVCVFCGKDNVIDYKDTAKLKKYVSERGKILPRRITGTCAKQNIDTAGIKAVDEFLHIVGKPSGKQTAAKTQ
jgi:small subunit ribosomal protein S18